MATYFTYRKYDKTTHSAYAQAVYEVVYSQLSFRSYYKGENIYLFIFFLLVMYFSNSDTEMFIVICIVIGNVYP